MHSEVHSHHHDLNQKAAFMHVVADAVTSIFAIIALIFGKYLGWDFLDAALGIVGSILVAKWALSLMQETGKTLLDAEMDHHVVDEIREVLAELPQTTLTDLHVWKVGKGKVFLHFGFRNDGRLNCGSRAGNASRFMKKLFMSRWKLIVTALTVPRETLASS